MLKEMTLFNWDNLCKEAKDFLPPVGVHFLGCSYSKESACSAEDLFDPWVRKILWRREWQPTPVFLSGEFPGQRSLASYSTRGHKESDTTEWLTLSNNKGPYYFPALYWGCSHTWSLSILPAPLWEKYHPEIIGEETAAEWCSTLPEVRESVF